MHHFVTPKRTRSTELEMDDLTSDQFYATWKPYLFYTLFGRKSQQKDPDFIPPHLYPCFWNI